jgi:uncharacterized phage protein (TIGR02216 family)
MAFGLGVLKLRPHDFWAMTPKELAAALAGALPHQAPAAPLSRPDLDALMRRFPDATHVSQAGPCGGRGDSAHKERRT